MSYSFVPLLTLVVEREILVFQYHPVLALLHREVLDVGEKGDGNDNLAAVGELDDKLPAAGKIQILFFIALSPTFWLFINNYKVA